MRKIVVKDHQKSRFITRLKLSFDLNGFIYTDTANASRKLIGWYPHGIRGNDYFFYTKDELN